MKRSNDYEEIRVKALSKTNGTDSVWKLNAPGDGLLSALTFFRRTSRIPRGSFSSVVSGEYIMNPPPPPVNYLTV